MTETAAFFIGLAVVLLVGIVIGYFIGLRTAKPNVRRIARKHWPYHDLYRRIDESDLFSHDEKLLLGVMMEDYAKDNL